MRDAGRNRIKPVVLRTGFAAAVVLAIAAGSSLARSGGPVRTTVSAGAGAPRVPFYRPQQEPDVVGDPTGAAPIAKALQDTIWIADWTFAGPGGSCTEGWWTGIDNRIVRDVSNYWVITDSYNGTGGIANGAAALKNHDVCWPNLEGYGNDWDYSIRLKYQGASTLSFDYLLDTEPWDFMQVEADSAGASFARVNYLQNPAGTPDRYRRPLYQDSDYNHPGSVSGLALPDFADPVATHHVYIRFKSNREISPEDTGNWATLLAGLVVDNIEVQGAVLSYTENFEGALNANVELINSAPDRPFGEWGRIFAHITDNDKCTENTTCAWLWSDHTTPTLFYYPSMGFGPNGFVVHSWLDNIIQGPLVSLADTWNAKRTILSYRIFGGNYFGWSRIVVNASVRGLLRCDNTDTSAPGDSVDSLGPWGNPWWWTNDSFTWITRVEDLTPWLSQYLWPEPREIQVRFRVSDWQYIAGYPPPGLYNPGPGPYIDRVRIGRRVLTGPLMRLDPDSRVLAQDAFATEQNAMPGEHFRPSGDRFGTCAFSSGDDLGAGWSPNLITGDSIVIQVFPRPDMPVAWVKLFAWIVDGPHQGKAPAPYAAAPGGLFEVTAEQVRIPRGEYDVLVMDKWCVDFDDTYFRGGDVLQYVWMAADAGGAVASYPIGIGALPFPPREIAERQTNGLFEVNFLPRIDWDPAYVARIQADPHGDLDPTPEEVANSSQRSCLLYVQQVNRERRSGDVNRTSFLYTLDRLGYRGYYDVYDDQGINTWLAGRAFVSQASGYALIIQDCGRYGWVSKGDDLLWSKLDQAGWYSDYLDQGFSGLAGRAGLWLIGENVASYLYPHSLLTGDMGVGSVVSNQGTEVSPGVLGVASFSFYGGCDANFNWDGFKLAGGCPNLRQYDGLQPTGTAVATHEYWGGTTLGPGAVVMNKNSTYAYNTVATAFNWTDMQPSGLPFPTDEEEVLAGKILNCVLPANCHREPNVTDGGGDAADAVPLVTALHQNVPNPFNPTTTVPFDMARPDHARLELFDVSGRRVRTLVDADLPAGRHRWTWNGLDESGARVASGVYFIRLRVGDFASSRRIVVLR